MPLHNMTNMYLKVIYGDYQPALQCDTNLTSANTATITNCFDIYAKKLCAETIVHQGHELFLRRKRGG